MPEEFSPPSNRPLADETDPAADSNLSQPAPSPASAVAHGTKSLALAQVFNQVTRLVTNIVLARLLVPASFGLVAVAAVVISFLDQLKDGGTGSAIIQRKEVPKVLLNTVFALNVALGVLMAILLAISASPLANLLADQDATPVLRVFAAITFITSLGQVHHAMLRRDLRFKTIAVVSAIGTVAMGVSSITGASLGMGVWALVLGSLVGACVDTSLVWVTDRWRPGLEVSWSSLQSIWSYSANLFAGNVLTFFFSQSDKLLVSRYLGPAPLGIYSMAQRILSYPLTSIANVVNEVLFPALAQRQDNIAAMRSGYVRATQVVALVTFPLMGLATALSPWVVSFVLGPNWAELTPLIWVLAPVGALQSVTASAGGILMAKGRTDSLLKVTTITSVIVVLAYILGLRWGLLGMCVTYAIAVLITTPLQLLVSFREVELRVVSYLRGITPLAAYACVAGGATWALAFNVADRVGDLATIAIGIPTYLSVFMTLVLLGRHPAYREAVATIRIRRSSLNTS